MQIFNQKRCAQRLGFTNLDLMRFLLILLFSTAILSAQVIDDFSDGDFTTNPTWEGDTDDWIVDTGQLRSNGPAEQASIFLSTAISLDNGPLEWRFFVNPKTNPSANNFMRVYLFADNADLPTANSFSVRVGGDTDDRISLFSLMGGVETLLINGVEDAVDASESPYNVSVIYDAGLWTLSTDAGAFGLFEEIGSASSDLSLGPDGHFGVSATFTSSNSQKYFFDDFYFGDVVVDDTPPEVVSALPTSNNELLVAFSEPITAESAVGTNFSISGFGEPQVLYDISNPSEVTLLFIDDVFPEDQTLTLGINNIVDFSGNVLNNSNQDFVFTTTDALAILITEIYADFEPVMGLPEEEFVEIYNASSETVSLLGWTFSDDSNSGSFSSASIDPGEYAIVCAEDNVPLFEPLGKTIGLSSLPGLNNGGDELSIRNSEGKLIHEVNYKGSWYQDALKELGGWSLEMIDPENPCAGMENWIASNAPIGGTPGTVNSVDADNLDTTAPVPQQVLFGNLTNISVLFSEPFFTDFFPTANQFSIEGINGDLVLSVDSVSANTVNILLPEPLEQEVLYELEVSGDIFDCAGNNIGESSTLLFGVPQEPLPLDIIINEILFNPFTNGMDFVELYNNSNKIIDLRNLRIANADTLGSEILDDVFLITDESNFILPGEYAVLSDDPETVLEQYETVDPNVFVNLSGFPSYPDDEGIVVLVAFNGVEIDRVCYLDDWHHPLVDDQNGVSLERIDFDLPSNDSNSWQSATSNVGYATPGLRNSSFVITDISTNTFEVSPPSFSPDNDGFDDFSFLEYNLDRSGFSTTIKIFNDRGLLIRTLANNELLGLNGIIRWDGTNENGQKATIGKYIWLIELFHPDGETISEKVVVTLAGFLD